MKKLFSSIFALIAITIIMAQNLPIDSDVKIGKLKNGMTYYIRENKKPEKKVEFRLVVNAGSINEDDDQQGLAHFMEHMNFNGTKHFPENKLVDALQSLGIKFGQHLNAYTSFDETVYMLPVPLDKPENLDKGLLVIEDWAFNALLTDKQIDKERGVVLEELRIGLGADKKMLDRYLPKVAYKSKYAERLPIGKKEILENFEYEALRRFRNDWYRPDNMAIIVVGDIDAKEIEAKIIKNFSKYKNPKNPKKRVEYELPNHTETLIAVESEPDATFTNVDFVYKDKENRKPTLSVQDYVANNILDDVFSTLLNNRFDELANSNNPPFTYAYSYHGTSWARTKEGFQSGAMCNEGKAKDALKVILQEHERVKKYGFTQSELDRAKAQILANVENEYKDREKTESENWVWKYVSNFLESTPITGTEWKYKTYNKEIPAISLQQVNNIINNYIREDNRVVVITGPNKETIQQPKESEILALFEEVKNLKIDAYTETQVASSLIKSLPEKGNIVSETKNNKINTTTFTLSNGVKVSYKKTDFKEDEIKFQAISLGGTSVYDDETYRKTQWANRLLDEAGVAGLSKNDLTKYLSGKIVEIYPYISNITEGLQGSCAPKDIKTLFELIYSYFTQLNKNADAYKGAVEKQKSIFSNIASRPENYFSKEVSKFLNTNNPRFTNIFPTDDEWKNTDYALAHQLFTQKLADADDFQFLFVGNIDENELKMLCEKYLAVLPFDKNKTENYIDTKYRNIIGKYEKEYNKGKDPKSQVRILFYGETAYSKNEELAIKALANVLTIKLVEQLRETESGVYGVGAFGSMSKLPYCSYNLTIQFPCGPENAEKLTKSALSELQKIIDNGPQQKDIDKFKEGELNDVRDNLKKNEFWLNSLSKAYRENANPEDVLQTEAMIKGIDAKQIQEVAKKYFTQYNLIATLYPEK